MNCLIAALVMSMGWSIRGRYGHCTGAMMPGALFAMYVVVSSARPHWWRRAAIAGLAGAAGWAFGGQTSYGLLVGYTATDSLVDIAYGYAAFVLAGAMWGAIGAGMLGLALTLPRSQVNAFIAPLFTIGAVWVAADWSGARARMPNIHDTFWFEATTALAVAAVYWLAIPSARKACSLIIALATGWWLGLAILTLLLGLRLNPPRSDSWAACLGVTIAMFVYLRQTNNRAALLLARYGLLAGGLGFLLGDLVQIVQRAHWGPFQYAVLQEHGGWGKMEKLFGFIMGLGVALGVRRLGRDGLLSPVEDDNAGYGNEFAVFVLFVPMMLWNFGRNVLNWEKAQLFPERFLAIAGHAWAILVVSLWILLLLTALYRHRRVGLALVPSSALGKGQLLFLILQWLIVGASFAGSLPNLASPSVATSEIYYVLCASAASAAILLHSVHGLPAGRAGRDCTSAAWRASTLYGLAWLAAPALVLALAWFSASIAPPTKNPQAYRFPKNVEAAPAAAHPSAQ